MTQQALLLIADIGGYTRFMTEHRLNLAHAQLAVAGLLEAVLDAAGELKLAKLEGDAAFLWAPATSAPQPGALTRRLLAIRESFHRRRQRMVVDRACTCEGCMQLERLTLKFVVHQGEVAVQKIRRHSELAGVDVILLHRMLKNEVPVPEYALLTPPALAQLEPELVSNATALEHDFDGLGKTLTHWVDLRLVAPSPPVPAPSFWRRWWKKLVLEVQGLPYLLGFKKPLVGFRNIER